MNSSFDHYPLRSEHKPFISIYFGKWKKPSIGTTKSTRPSDGIVSRVFQILTACPPSRKECDSFHIIVRFLIITMLNILKHIMLYMFTLFIGMIGDEANGWGTSHLEPPENKKELTLRF